MIHFFDFFGGDTVMHIKQKIDFLKKKLFSLNIHMVDLYVNLSQFLLLPGSGTTFPEVDPDK